MRTHRMWGTGTGAAALVMFFLAFAGGRAMSAHEASAMTEAADSAAVAALVPGRQLVMVYIGSSRCGPSNAAELPQYVEELTSLVRAQALTANKGFVTIGVARELNPVEGMLHLGKFGSFDEIAAGQGLLNQAATRFITTDHPGIGATPQLVVLERTLVAGLSGVDASQVEERVLLRKVGVAEIANWLQMGGKLPSVARENAVVKNVDRS